MDPAQECFDADHLAVGETHLGLIVNGGEVLERRAAKFWGTRAQRTSLAEATSDGPATEHLVAAV